MKKMIDGDVFVIPNSCCRVADLLPSSQEAMIENLRRFGIDADMDTVLVQVWATGSKVDNWSCHGWLPEILNDEELDNADFLRISRFPDYLPVDLFSGRVEGQIVTITTTEPKVTINLKLNQLQYRYKDWGPFEKVLQKKVVEMEMGF